VTALAGATIVALAARAACAVGSTVGPPITAAGVIAPGTIAARIPGAVAPLVVGLAHESLQGCLTRTAARRLAIPTR
jgi:hypothetical protein